MVVTGTQQHGASATLNIPGMLYGPAEASRDQVVLRKKDRGIWKATTRGELADKVRDIGMGLKAVGFMPGDVACILAETSPAWVIADLAVLGAGGISAGLYTTLAPNDLQSELQDCGCRIVFVGNDEQLDKLIQVRGACPRLERIVIFDIKGLRDFSDPMCESFEAFSERGQIWNTNHPDQWTRGIAAITPEDGAVLMYTSGATGAPKGILLSHRNIMAQISSTAAALGQCAADERLAFLPMPHFIERIHGFYQSLYSGTISNYVENAETVRENMQEILPTVAFAPPYVWEKIYIRIASAVSEASWLQRKLYAAAIAAGKRLAIAERVGNASIGQRIIAKLGSLLILRNISRQAGMTRMRIACVGGAPVSPELLSWYNGLGVRLTEFYGLSETAGLALLPSQGGVGDSINTPLGDAKLSDSGELLVRGDHVYSHDWRDGRAEDRPVAEWFATGDSARLESGRLHITGRNSDRIASRAGRSVMPSEIEAALTTSPFISDALVVGNGREHLACLVMIDYESVESWAQRGKVVFSGVGNLARTDAVRELIGREIARINDRLTDPVLKFRLIERKLEAEDLELSPVMKLRRSYVSETYKDLIESMYCKA